jgi:hypothetical protein
MKYVKKSGHGEEWVNLVTIYTFESACQNNTKLENFIEFSYINLSALT